MRKLGFLVALTTVGALVGVVPAAFAPVAAGAQTQDNTAFCQAAFKADKTSTAIFSSGKKPSKKAQQELESALTEATNTAPPEVVANVQAAANEIITALQSGKEPSQEALQPNITALDQYRYNSCGYPTADVTGIEYEFQGMPKTVPQGPLAIKFTDSGTEVHELVVARIKGKESLKKIVSLSEKEQDKKLEFVNGTEVTPGQTGYEIVDFAKPGRYAVVCYVDVGATTEAAAHSEHGGTPHAKKGMYQEVKVTAGSTTTNAG